MHFAVPVILWSLLALPVVGWLRWRQRRAALTHPAVTGFARLLIQRSRFIAVVLLVLELAGLASLILALARPRWPDAGSRLPAHSSALQVVLDVSGSMAEQDFLLAGGKVTRLEAACAALRELLSENGETHLRAEDQVGLLTFATQAELVCPPTLSHGVLVRMLEGIKPLGAPPDSSTNIGDALAESIALLRRARPVEKAILLITDGEHNVPAMTVSGALKPWQAARLAQPLGVRIHTVFVGPDDSAGAQAREALSQVAAQTGGLFFRAGDAAGLQELCERIAHAERTRVESFQYARHNEAYPWCGLAWLTFILSRLLLEGTRWLRIP
jgi:Ca-activated chloride channel family protein